MSNYELETYVDVTAYHIAKFIIMKLVLLVTAWKLRRKIHNS